jgi:hypothetical protein
MILITSISMFFFLWLIYMRLPKYRTKGTFLSREDIKSHPLATELTVSGLAVATSGTVTGMMSGLMANMLFSFFVTGTRTTDKWLDKLTGTKLPKPNNNKLDDETIQLMQDYLDKLESKG